MRDNIKSFAGEREKRKGSGEHKPFFREAEFPVARFDFQWSDGSRICVASSHLVRFEYFPQTNQPGVEIIMLDLPGQMRMQITGRGIVKLYELLREDRLLWVREADLEENDDGQDIYVQRLGNYDIYDWESDLEAVDGRREEILGSRRYGQQPKVE